MKKVFSDEQVQHLSMPGHSMIIMITILDYSIQYILKETMHGNRGLDEASNQPIITWLI